MTIVTNIIVISINMLINAIIISVIIDSDSQLVKDGAAWSRRVKVTKARTSNGSLRLHWISQDWGSSVRPSITNCHIVKYHNDEATIVDAV